MRPFRHEFPGGVKEGARTHTNGVLLSRSTSEGTTPHFGLLSDHTGSLPDRIAMRDAPVQSGTAAEAEFGVRAGSNELAVVLNERIYEAGTGGFAYAKGPDGIALALGDAHVMAIGAGARTAVGGVVEAKVDGRVGMGLGLHTVLQAYRRPNGFRVDFSFDGGLGLVAGVSASLEVDLSRFRKRQA
ncbi:MAG: hypothetical protein AAF658_09565 [Myxococcota bacterium]